MELSPVNVIIGPQGSGKSVTTKLMYFCSDIPIGFLSYAENGSSFEEYKKIISRQFNVWFPPSAWGNERFIINYSCSLFQVRIMRRMSKGKLTDDVSLKFSDWFIEIYEYATDLFEKNRTGEDVDIATSATFAESIDRGLRIRDTIARRIAKDMGDSYLSRQTFIPAGRAFFTSIGKLVAGIQQAASLDPVTIKFARLFADIRDLNARNYQPRLSRLNNEFREKRDHVMNKLFGGDVKFDRESECVETIDGRKIPFASLSSGQQELLPMWTLIDYFNQIDASRLNMRTAQARRTRELLYIEEPEAHLFPSAQSLLMDFLIGSVVSEKSRRSLIITTHSPYIMSKLNVFLKAGQLSRRKKRNQDINAIVPRECWLEMKDLSAFAIIDGRLEPLIDEDGLIDGRYLDNISEEISRQFSQLLQIESEI